MGVRKCPKCGSVWYTALVKCAFCGVEGEEVKGPISPARINLGRGGVAAGPPPPKEPNSEPAAPMETKEAAPVAVEPPPPPPPPPAAVVEAPPAPTPENLAPATEILKPTEPPPAAAAEERPAARPQLVRRIQPPPESVDSEMPAPGIPSATVPLVFGGLGALACVILPLIGYVRNDRVLEVLALLAWAVLAPFAPFAWFTGQRYAERCRLLGFRPAGGACTGRTLGMMASFLMVFEFAALAIYVAVLTLSGQPFPK